MNWRATHILTGRRDLAIVPNSTIAKSKIVNVSSPSGMRGTTITIQIDAKTSPLAGIEILQHAVLNCLLIVSTPSPVVAVKSINANYTELDVTFFVSELSATTRAQNELFDLIYRHLTASSIVLASSNGPSNQTGTDPAAGRPASHVEIVLGLVTIFAALTASERTAIAANLTQHFHDRGEVLLEPGTVLNTLFIAASGVLSLTRDEDKTELMRLGPGDHFGEIGLLTGAPSTVTITALTPVVLYQLAKEDLVPILESRSEVSHELSRALAQRKAAGRLTAAPDLGEAVPANTLTTWFSDRIHRLYGPAGIT
jgi:hypothetical protein